MTEIKWTDGAVEIFAFGRSVFRFDRQASPLSVGRGSATYKMKRGSFKFREKAFETVPLFFGAPKPEAGAVELADKGGNVLFLLKASVDGGLLRLRLEPLTQRKFNRLTFRLPAEADEHVYGSGETFTKFDLRGETARVWVAEHSSAARIAKKVLYEKVFGKKPKRVLKFSSYETYYAQPTFVSSRRYFVHIDSNAYMDFDFTRPDRHEIRARGFGEICLGFAEDFESLSRLLASLLGRQPRLPDWAYDGAILGIQGGTQAVLDKLEKAKSENMKVCGVWCQDWEGERITFVGKQLMWNWAWDRELYPNLDAVIPQLKGEGVRFLGYCNPFLAVEKELYKEASAKGYCVKNSKGEDYLVTTTTFPAAMVDLSNPEASEWIKRVIQVNMIDFGLGGWMADFGEYLPTDCVLHSGEPAEEIHNAWPAIWAKINREAVEERGKLGEVFFFTRAGHTQTVRYSTLMWTGDQQVDWSFAEAMPSVIPASLSLAMCGFGLAHSDVGGYATFAHIRREPEQLMRWAEMSVFSPLFRSHEGNRPGDNVQFDSTPEILRHYARMSRLHAALAPYLKEADRVNSETGVPVMRPLFFYYDEPRAYTEMYEYLLGRDILVAPVLEKGQTVKAVYLPADRWVHLWSGKVYGGGEHAVGAPLGKPPVFCRADSGYLEAFLKLSAIE